MGFFGSLFGGGMSEELKGEIRSAVQKGARVIDVRTPGEFASGNVGGSINIPLQDLSSSLGKVGKSSRPVVLYCRSGSRSAMAARILRSNGYERVLDAGAIHNWPL